MDALNARLTPRLMGLEGRGYEPIDFGAYGSTATAEPVDAAGVDLAPPESPPYEPYESLHSNLSSLNSPPREANKVEAEVGTGRKPLKKGSSKEKKAAERKATPGPERSQKAAAAKEKKVFQGKKKEQDEVAWEAVKRGAGVTSSVPAMRSASEGGSDRLRDLTR